MAKGKSGSFRAKSLGPSDLQAMENHELRLDFSGARRSVRKDENGIAIPPLIYNPLRANSLTQAHTQHVEGAKVNKGAAKIARHAFIQFPTDMEITSESQQMMLDQAVAFVNKTHGGQAVFWARIDRDEEGQHGVDVFFAPKYEKVTKRKTEVWISLTKFGKLRAVERFKQKPLEKRNVKTGEFEPVKDAKGNPVMVDCDSKYYQGVAFQDLWFEHLRDAVGLDWVRRGQKKIGRDPDRLEVEEYKIQQEYEKLAAAEIEAEERVEVSARIETEQWDSASQAIKVRQEAQASTTEENRRLEEARKATAEANGEAEKARRELEEARRETAKARSELEEARKATAEANSKTEEAAERLRGLKALLEPLRPAMEAVLRYRQAEADFKRAAQDRNALQQVDVERGKAWLLKEYLSFASPDDPATPKATQSLLIRLKAGTLLPNSVEENRGVYLGDLVSDVEDEVEDDFDAPILGTSANAAAEMFRALVKHPDAWPVHLRTTATGEVRAKVSYDTDRLREVFGLPPENSDAPAHPIRLMRWSDGQAALTAFSKRISEVLTKVASWYRANEPVTVPPPVLAPEAKPFLELPRATQQAVEKTLASASPATRGFEP